MIARPSLLAVTMGEPSGIGPELTVKCWLRRDELPVPFVVIGDASRLQAEAERLRAPVVVQPVATPVKAVGAFARALPVIDLPLAEPAEPGRLNPSNAAAVIGWIARAAELAAAGEVDGIVTNPIHKHNLYGAGFRHPGHTEYLAELAGADVEPVMMLACDGLRAVPVSTHLSLRDAVDQLDAERIVSQARITARALVTDFGLSAPRLAVAGLNPHAGENGAMGDEESRIIAPAIERLRADGVMVSGPHPPDTMFSAAMRATYDAAICMYHDQALIP
ncbi:MAG: 4-hydroxythreonine-4-phosphate dehydrogenase PdxA, partial [Rhodospirillaceae bacterium]